jgi:O-6-methylguanine DNA methyltransferase
MKEITNLVDEKLLSKEKISKKDIINNLNLLEKTDFEKSVLLIAYKIPKGKVSTYKRIAEKVGRPSAYRAVGNALHNNPLAPIVPCHRVVRTDGRIVGKDTIKSRRSLLVEEGIPLIRNRVKLSSDILF